MSRRPPTSLLSLGLWRLVEGPAITSSRFPGFLALRAGVVLCSSELSLSTLLLTYRGVGALERNRRESGEGDAEPGEKLDAAGEKTWLLGVKVCELSTLSCCDCDPSISRLLVGVRGGSRLPGLNTERRRLGGVPVVSGPGCCLPTSLAMGRLGLVLEGVSDAERVPR